MMNGDEEFGHFLPVLRRIIILVAVITAIPVVLWTITAFVRTYVSPPKIPTFHQLAATASINAPSNPGVKQEANQSPPGTAEGATNSLPSPATVEARATQTDTRDAPKGSFLGDRSPESVTAGPPVVSAPVVTAPVMTAPAVTAPKMPEMASATAPAVTPAETVMPPATVTAADGAPPRMAVAAQQPAAADETSADNASVTPAAEPLSGPIPLPRRRPHVVVAVEPGAPAQTTRMASVGPIPMPRPRPEAAGPAASGDDSGSNPLGFIQNLFGGGK